MFWDPMPNAPRDGTRIILLYENGIACCGSFHGGWVPDIMSLANRYPILWQRIPDNPHQAAIEWHAENNPHLRKSTPPRS